MKTTVLPEMKDYIPNKNANFARSGFCHTTGRYFQKVQDLLQR
jgi:hypothetical protein